MRHETSEKIDPNVRYVFFGTPTFAANVLRKLLKAGYRPSGIVTNPDRPAGRKKIITAPPIKQLVGREDPLAAKILQPERLNNDETERTLRALRPDVFIVSAYARIIPKKLLAIPRLGTIGVHPSLLPRHRGPSPIQTTILEGDREAGVSLYVMDEKIDHGPIIAHTVLHGYDSGTANYEQLENKLADLAGDLLIKTLPAYYEGSIKPEPQDERLATYTKKFKTEDGFVEPEALVKAVRGSSVDAERINKQARALNPEPGCWTIWNGRRMKILHTNIANGKLILTEIQFAGEKPRKGEPQVTI